MIRMRKNDFERQRRGNVVTQNVRMSTHNGSECQTEEDDGFKCQTQTNNDSERQNEGVDLNDELKEIWWI